MDNEVSLVHEARNRNGEVLELMYIGCYFNNDSKRFELYTQILFSQLPRKNLPPEKFSHNTSTTPVPF